MNGEDLLDAFAVKAYEPPLSLHRESGRIADVSDPVSVIMLVVDLDTEVSMNGITDFIGNSTGLYAAETAQALEQIGCQKDAGVLRQILDAAHGAGMTHEAIQAERSGVPPYTVTSFSKLHGTKRKEAVSRIERLHRLMDFEGIRRKAADYVAEHETLVRRVLGR